MWIVARVDPKDYSIVTTVSGVNEFANKDFAGEDVRDGIVGAVAVKIQDPVFESQTKNKLGSTDVKP